MKARVYALIVLAIFLAVLAVMGAGYYTNGFEAVSSLYVKSGSEVYTGNADLTVTNDKEITIQVKSAGFKNYTTPEYTVQVVSVGDFEYTVNGTPYKWTAGEDLSEQFLISQNGGNVTFAALTFDEYLGYIYPNAECSHDMAGKPFYSVNITSDKRTVALNVIAIKETIPAEGIEIVPDEVITG